METTAPNTSGPQKASAPSPSTSPQEIDDLRRRLDATRLPETELVADASRACSWRRPGARPLLGRRLRHGRLEARLNALPQFTTEIDGLDIHFIHVKSRHENALPLIITHGWPGSVVEMLEVIGPLTDPTAHGGSAEDAFDLVLPVPARLRLLGAAGRVGWDPATSRRRGRS